MENLRTGQDRTQSAHRRAWAEAVVAQGRRYGLMKQGGRCSLPSEPPDARLMPEAPRRLKYRPTQ